MSALFAFMILVTCSDSFTECMNADRFLIAYASTNRCEQALEPSLKNASLQGGQIFGQCITAELDLLSSDDMIYWQVSPEGDFYVEIQQKTEEYDHTPIITTGISTNPQWINPHFSETFAHVTSWNSLVSLGADKG